MTEGYPKFDTPFKAQRTEEERARDTRDTLTISLNKEERAAVDALKKMLNIHMDGTAIKAGMMAGKNVLQATLGADFLAYLSDPARRRYLEK